MACVTTVAALPAVAGGASVAHAAAGLTRAAAACPGAETPIGSTTLAASRAALSCLIGAVRAERGLGPVRADDRLAAAARSHAADMVRRGYFAHRSPDGSKVGDRLAHAGWTPSRGSWWAGEILVAGSGAAGTPRRLVAAWLMSPHHRSVLLSARPNAIGLGAVRNTPDREHANTGITVDAVFARHCAGGPGATGTDPLSGYRTRSHQDREPDLCAA
ncbi:MAG TPA: CAP domain-containing protein [Baekduia sp.]|uniref:CAP domain-containing protein n=1 Tax=Baekduia sp. TaxID=2600305 RepID=UPI002D771E1C|nr:CAP domain-containing protein [Baekduia sp.]HET6509163.1 CAP domain-containing protein [Baekduia sp.]